MLHIRRLVLLASLLSVSEGIGQTTNSPPSVSSEALRLDFDKGRGNLAQIIDLKRHVEFLAIGDASPLWTLEFRDGTTLEPSDAAEFSWRAAPGSRSIQLVWSGFSSVAAPKLAVLARADLADADAVSRWSLAIEGLGGLAPRAIVYPRIGQLTPASGEVLLVPQWIGEATDQARRLVNTPPGRAGRLAWDYPGILSMQFLAYYAGDGRGLMVSVDDAQHLRKQFSAFGDGASGLGLEVKHEVAGAERPMRLDVPYRTEIRVFQGDWFTAAALYRQWASAQWWVRESRVRRGLTPAWIRDAGLWIWNRGRSPEVLQPALALRRHAGAPVNIFWHWWHGCAYDVGFPEYFPPREGAESFRAAVAEARRRDVNAVIYMNQRLWGMTTRSWTAENAAAYAVKDAQGAIQPEVYNTFVNAPCASMCMGTRFWRDKYAGLAERALRDLGVAGVYMDQACSSLSCYDPSHGHPLGGGAYWMDGFKQLSEDIRGRLAEPIALAGEGCGEGWLPYLDAMLSLQVSLERYSGDGAWEPLPLFNAVYHDCATQYGNYSSLTRPPYDDLWPPQYAPQAPLELLDRKFATQFRLEQARSFVWGQQPTIANFQERQLAERRDEIDYVLRIARMRSQALKYLRDGLFLRPPCINAPRAEIPISRLSIYAGQLNAVQERTKSVPLGLASAWRAPDGDVAVVLANIADQELPLHVAICRPEYPIPSEGEVVLLDDDGRRRERRQYEQGTVNLKVRMNPRELRIYEIAAEKPQQ
ncbi:MAG: hypothetical protein IT424_07760 [Pirellulales bacterium]|nr:hypothetical protein [Pirellulales bacterium]